MFPKLLANVSQNVSQMSPKCLPKVFQMSPQMSPKCHPNVSTSSPVPFPFLSFSSSPFPLFFLPFSSPFPLRSWRLLPIFLGSERLLAIPSGSWRPGGSRRCLAALGDSWRLLAAPGDLYADSGSNKTRFPFYVFTGSWRRLFLSTGAVLSHPQSK